MTVANWQARQKDALGPQPSWRRHPRHCFGDVCWWGMIKEQLVQKARSPYICCSTVVCWHLHEKVALRQLCLTWIELMGSSILPDVALFRLRPKEFATYRRTPKMESSQLLWFNVGRWFSFRRTSLILVGVKMWSRMGAKMWLGVLASSISISTVAVFRFLVRSRMQPWHRFRFWHMVLGFLRCL